MASNSKTGCKDYFQYLKHRMVQQKKNDPSDLKTQLQRCLSTTQLTFLGVGNTIGVGIYVLLGVIAKEYAGPSAVLCFLIAIGVTMLNALVFSEFSTLVTQTGASYVFLYKVSGEFVAFLCGWLMIISNISSGCIGARAWSGLLDSSFNNSIQAYTTSVLGELQFGPPFAKSLDVMAFAFQLVLTIVVSCNVRCSSVLNTLLTVMTVSVLVFVAVAGPVFGDSSNFLNEDHGGFFPFGLAGVVKGASVAMYACSGFEVVSMSAEEAKDPRKSVPRAIILELMIVATVYVAACVGILFLVPYWLLDTKAPLPSAFDHKGMVWGKFLVIVGPLISFTNLQMLNSFSNSRLIYRMACDGLFFPCFLKINKRTGVPVNSTILSGVVTSILALMFDLSFLIEMTILLMLILFICVGPALIKLKATKINPPTTTRYSKVENKSDLSASSKATNNSTNQGKGSLENGVSLNTAISIDGHQSLTKGEDEADSVIDSDFTEIDKAVAVEACSSLFTQLRDEDGDDSGESESEVFVQDRNSHHSEMRNAAVHEKNSKSLTLRQRISARCSLFVPGVLSVNVVVIMHWLCCMGLAYQINYGWQDLMDRSVIAVGALCLLVFLLILLTFLLWTQTSESSSSSFQTPLMPLVPTLSLLFSSTLFFSAAKTVGFIEMGVLLLIGCFLYFIIVYLDLRSKSDGRHSREQTTSLIGDDDGSDNDEL